jgi:dolichol-phosphate hexosyltransferase
MIVIDGKSSDNTVHVAKNLGVDVIFQEGTRKGGSISFGIKNIATNANFIVLSDADYTYPYEHIPDMITILGNNPEVERYVDKEKV